MKNLRAFFSNFVPLCLCPFFPLFKLCAFATLPLCLFSCSSNLPAGKYIAYYESNKTKFSRSFERGEVRATIAYVPAEYYAAKQMQFDTTLSLDSAMKRYANSLVFLLIVKGTGKTATPVTDRGGMQEYSQNIQKSTFGHDQDVFLLNGPDTVRALYCNFDRNWGMVGEDAFCLGFSNKDRNKNIMKYHLIFRDVIPEFGTIDVPINEIIKRGKRLKG